MHALSSLLPPTIQVPRYRESLAPTRPAVRLLRDGRLVRRTVRGGNITDTADPCRLPAPVARLTLGFSHDLILLRNGELHDCGTAAQPFPPSHYPTSEPTRDVAHYEWRRAGSDDRLYLLGESGVVYGGYYSADVIRTAFDLPEPITTVSYGGPMLAIAESGRVYRLIERPSFMGMFPSYHYKVVPTFEPMIGGVAPSIDAAPSYAVLLAKSGRLYHQQLVVTEPPSSRPTTRQLTLPPGIIGNRIVALQEVWGGLYARGTQEDWLLEWRMANNGYLPTTLVGNEFEVDTIRLQQLQNSEEWSSPGGAGSWLYATR